MAAGRARHRQGSARRCERALADFGTLPKRITAFFEWKSDTRVAGDAERAVAVLRHMRAAARGLRRAERYLEVVWMRRS